MSNELITQQEQSNTERLYTQKEIAEEMGVTQAAISQQITSLGLEPRAVGQYNQKRYSLKELGVLRQQQQLKLKTEQEAAMRQVAKVEEKGLTPYVMQSALQKLSPLERADFGIAMMMNLRNDLAIAEEQLKLEHDELDKWRSFTRICKDVPNDKISKDKNGKLIACKTFVDFCKTHNGLKSIQDERFEYVNAYHKNDIEAFYGVKL